MARDIYQQRYERMRVSDIKDGRGTAFWHYKAASTNAVMQRRGGARIVSAGFLRNLFITSGCACFYCEVSLSTGTKIGGNRNQSISVDHVVPGFDELWNLVIACGRCNRMKSDANVDELERVAAKVREYVTARADLYQGRLEKIWPEMATAAPPHEVRQISLFDGETA